MVSLRGSALSVVSVVLVMAGCSGGGVPPPAGSAQADSAQAGPPRVESSSCDSTAQPSSGPDRDEISPLIVSVLAPDPIPGVKYFDVVKPEYGDMKPIFDLAKEIMAGAEKGK